MSIIDIVIHLVVIIAAVLSIAALIEAGEDHDKEALKKELERIKSEK